MDGKSVRLSGSLVEQWQDEMSEKFSLGFDILTRDQVEASITGNPFVEKNRLILRLDSGNGLQHFRPRDDGLQQINDPLEFVQRL